MKKTNLRTLLLTAAVSGVLAGIAAPVQASTTSGTPVLLAQNQPADKNSCNGKQDQQSQTNKDKKDSQPTDKDKNSCKGKNGCGASAPKA